MSKREVEIDAWLHRHPGVALVLLVLLFPAIVCAWAFFGVVDGYCDGFLPFWREIRREMRR